MTGNVPAGELQSRMQRLRKHLDLTAPEWELAAVMTKINIYYLTGTLQSGVVLIPRDGDAVFCVRRSFLRAQRESAFADIRPMKSFRDAAAALSHHPRGVHLETEGISLAHYERFRKYFGTEQFLPLDPALAAVRAVKSPYEIECMERAGRIHAESLNEKVPGLLREGISEAELAAELLHVMLVAGHDGIVRSGIYDTELFFGSFGFSENTLEPNSFDGPDGVEGLCAAVPFLGSRDRRLKAGDLVLVDLGCNVEGYHTDKTVIYAFGTPPPGVSEAHATCLTIMERAAEALRPGVLPSEIYRETIASLDASFRENFMGFGEQQVSFLGHGIGLAIAEYPVIAERFDEPLQENMVIALEPKKGLPGIGMVGCEETFIVTPDGGRCITGAQWPELRIV